MSSIVLKTVGTAVGAAVGGPLGAQVGGFLGGSTGGLFDAQLFGSGRTRRSVREGRRLDDLSVQTSTYGKTIPITYGTVRLAGNVIWSRPIKETATTTTSTTTTSGGKGGGGGGGASTVSETTTTYSYSVSLAIAICEGEIDEVLRVWADAKLLDVSQGTYRVYTGGENQLPDSYIEGFEGVGNTPAYRGVSYVVIEDFPLADYGNRIPNFTFEVQNQKVIDTPEQTPVEELITSVMMIPGSGEFVYDTKVQEKFNADQVNGTWIQRGQRSVLNAHAPQGKANVDVAIDQMLKTLPNLEWVGVVINWFGDSLDIAQCSIYPAVETSDGFTEPDAWSVAGQTRSTARRIGYDGDRPRYGGTPDDTSVVRLVDVLKARGLKVFAYPMPLMDIAGKPWRGEMTGAASAVTNFFTKSDGYNAFIMHYANLLGSKVDAFTIGTEMIKLTTISESAGSYPAVDQLVTLAASVKAAVSSNCLVTYAANWSEYHSAPGGWYHLDPLWASSSIDVVGIDAYFPLTNAPQTRYSVQDIIDGWNGGEGYDFYYTDAERTTTAPLGEEYAWKNIRWWWENTHTNPNSAATSWVPKGKKIWFTEYGFPSVDGAANEPNVFYDPSSPETSVPRFSKGVPDVIAQRIAIEGTEKNWANSDMVEHLFLWTWDARPYPQWPDLKEVWADGDAWERGHWVQGKFGVSQVSAVVQDLAARAGISDTQLQLTEVQDQLDGYIIDSPTSVRGAIEPLMQTYLFDMVESNQTLKAVVRGSDTGLTIPASDLLAIGTRENGDPIFFETVRQQELELPQTLDVQFLNKLEKYQTGTARAQRVTTLSQQQESIDISLAMSELQASRVAEIQLRQRWMERTAFQFSLPVSYCNLEPGDVVTIAPEDASAQQMTLRITRIQLGKPGVLRISALADDPSIYRFDVTSEDVTGTTDIALPTAETALELLDLPALINDSPSDSYMRIAMAGKAQHWQGAGLYRSDESSGDYEKRLDSDVSAIMGAALDILADSAVHVFDVTSSVTINILGEEGLVNATKLQVLNGANAALLGDEVIQFMHAQQLSEGQYRLSGLLRGRLGTEHHTASHVAGERFIMLDNRLRKESMPESLWGLERYYKAGTVGQALSEVTAAPFTYRANALKPYSPAHVAAARDGSGNITLSWIRRTRIGGGLRDGVDVPLSETSEMYEIDVLDGSGDVLRTLSATTPTIDYVAADQVMDFGATQSSLRVKIYQMSELVGRGTPADVVV